MSTTCQLRVQEGSSQQYEDECLSNSDCKPLAVASLYPAHPLPPFTQLNYALRKFSQIELFITDVFIFLSLYLTTTSTSLTPDKLCSSLTRQTSWQCGQNRIM